MLEQKKAVEAPPETSMRIALFWHLAKQPLWWLGILVDVGGFVAQIAALGLADVVFVQPILVMSLPFSLTLGAMAGSHRLSRRDLVAGVRTGRHASRCSSGSPIPAAGRVEVLGQRLGGPDLRDRRDHHDVPRCSRGTKGPIRAALLGAAAGSIHGATGTLMKSVSHHIGSEGLIHVLSYWETWALIALVPLGFLMVQSAFQAGDLRAGLPALEVAEPLIASMPGHHAPERTDPGVDAHVEGRDLRSP